MYKTDFPFFETHPDLLYLDSAATALKPRAVIERINQYLSSETAPVGRGLYSTSITVTETIEATRKQVMHWLDAEEGEVVFTHGATDALNLLANGFPFREGDEVILSESEHHANLVPWQQAVSRGARLMFIRHDESGRLDVQQLEESLSPRTRIVSLSLVSNVYGTLLPIGEIIQKLEKGNRPFFIVDASQAAPHLPLSIRTLGCDALVLAGHKLYGPEGIGVLWGTTPLLDCVTPLRTGGGMVEKVTTDTSVFAPLPTRLEAGSPNTAGILGLSAALSYLTEIGRDQIKHHTTEVSKAFCEALSGISGITLIGNPDHASGIISFTHQSIHPHDLAELLASRNICVRAGHQCAQPLHTARGLMGSVRVSIGLYNEPADAALFAKELQDAVSLFADA